MCPHMCTVTHTVCETSHKNIQPRCNKVHMNTRKKSLTFVGFFLFMMILPTCERERRWRKQESLEKPHKKWDKVNRKRTKGKSWVKKNNPSGRIYKKKIFEFIKEVTNVSWVWNCSKLYLYSFIFKHLFLSCQNLGIYCLRQQFQPWHKEIHFKSSSTKEAISS